MEGLRSLLIDTPFIHDVLKLNVQPADSDYAVDIRSPAINVSLARYLDNVGYIHTVTHSHTQSHTVTHSHTQSHTVTPSHTQSHTVTLLVMCCNKEMTNFAVFRSPRA